MACVENEQYLFAQQWLSKAILLLEAQGAMDQKLSRTYRLLAWVHLQLGNASVALEAVNKGNSLYVCSLGLKLRLDVLQQLDNTSDQQVLQGRQPLCCGCRFEHGE